MEITREDVAARTRVGKLAPQHPGRALDVAQAIKHPWYRCQALSTVAEYLSGRERDRVLVEALAAAQQQGEINRIVTVSSWPLRVLVDAGSGLADTYLEKLVVLADTEPHHLRRSHALQALAFAVSGHPELLGRVVPSLVDALIGGRGPRIDRCIRDTFELVQAAKPELTWAVAMHHKPGRQRDRLLAAIPR